MLNSVTLDLRNKIWNKFITKRPKEVWAYHWSWKIAENFPKIGNSSESNKKNNKDTDKFYADGAN